MVSRQTLCAQSRCELTQLDATDDATSSLPEDLAQLVGTIEVVLLRCYAKETASSGQPAKAKADNNKQGNKKAQKTVVIGQLDGVADYDFQYKPALMGLDGTFEAPTGHNHQAYRRASAAPSVTGAPPQSPRARLPGEDDQAYIARLLAMPSPGQPGQPSQPNNYDYYQTQAQYGLIVPNAAYEAYLRDRMFQQVHENLGQSGAPVNTSTYPSYYAANGWNPLAISQFQRGPVGYGTYPGYNAQQSGRQPPNSANTSVAGAKSNKSKSDAGKKSDVGWGDKDNQDTNAWQNDTGATNWDDAAGEKPKSVAGKKSVLDWGATAAEDKDKQDTNTWQNDTGAINWNDPAGTEVKKDGTQQAPGGEWGSDTQNAGTGDWNAVSQNDAPGNWEDNGNKEATTGAWGEESGNKGSGDWEATAKVETGETWGEESGKKGSGGWDNTANVEADDWAAPAPATTGQPIDTPATREPKVRQVVERKKKDRSADNAWSSPASEKQTSAGSQHSDHKFGQHRFRSWQQHTVATPVLVDGAADEKGHAAHAKSQKTSEKEKFTISAEPLFQIPQSVAEKTQASHQVQAGRGSLYEHSTSRPKYLDRPSKPYAVFTFKYRSRGKQSRHLPFSLMSKR